jgi:hypothetical protein
MLPTGLEMRHYFWKAKNMWCHTIEVRLAKQAFKMVKKFTKFRGGFSVYKKIQKEATTLPTIQAVW